MCNSVMHRRVLTTYSISQNMMDALFSSKSRLFQKVHPYAKFPTVLFGITSYHVLLHQIIFSHFMRVAADGYWIIVVFSFVETMIVVTLLYLRKWLSRLKANTVTRANESELFITAGRSLQTGVISNAIVAQWTWAATLLQRCGFVTLMVARYMCICKLRRLLKSVSRIACSCNTAWEFGISGV